MENDKFTEDFLADCKMNFERSFYWACKCVFEMDRPVSWLTLDVHKPLCDALQDRRILRLNVVLPRGWLKSSLCSIYYPLWRAMLDETYSCIIVMNTFTNATKKLLLLRKLMFDIPLLRAMYPHRIPDSSCKVSEESIYLPHAKEATFEVAGVGTQVTGRHPKEIIEDDTLAPESDDLTGDVAEPSPDRIAQVIGYHKSIHFLLTDFLKDRRIVVGTRWADRDLITHIMRNEPDYLTIERSALETNGVSDPDGTPVYPLRYGRIVLKEILNAVGPYMYSCLMLNTPINPLTQIFSRNDVKYYETPPKNLIVFTTVDPAPTEEAKKGADPDYNTVITAGLQLKDEKIFVYVLDYFRERCSPKALIDAIFTHVELYNPLEVGIESVAYQKTLIFWTKEMQQEKRMWFKVRELRPKGRSKAHIHGLCSLFESHRIFVRDWMTDFVQELISFPAGTHDDLIDAFAYQQQFWRTAELIEYKGADIPTDDPFSGASIIKQLEDRAKITNKFPLDTLPSPTQRVGNFLWN